MPANINTRDKAPAITAASYFYQGVLAINANHGCDKTCFPCRV